MLSAPLALGPAAPGSMPGKFANSRHISSYWVTGLPGDVTAKFRGGHFKFQVFFFFFYFISFQISEMPR